MPWMNSVRLSWGKDKQLAHFLLMIGLLLLLLPLRWLFAAAIAALLHELGHYVAVRSFGVQIHQIRLSASGAVMEADTLPPVAELICLLSGPMAGLLPMLFFRFVPIIAICGFVQSAYNLLPLYPLDGGRIVRNIIGSERICKMIEHGCLGVLVALCLYIYIRFNISLFILVIGLLFRKTPCKQ